MDTGLIGMAGMQGAGKDYMYDWLRLKLEDQWVTRIAFADGVREEVAREVLDAIGIGSPDFLKTANLGSWKKPYTDGQRFILQQWGTEFRRAQDPDYWVKHGMQRVAKEWKKGADLVVITDVRFANEAEAIRSAGGYVCQVVAGPGVRAERNGVTMEAMKAQSKHASEMIDFTCDFIISNNGGEPVLEPRLRKVLGIG